MHIFTDTTPKGYQKRKDLMKDRIRKVETVRGSKKLTLHGKDLEGRDLIVSLDRDEIDRILRAAGNLNR